MDRMVGIPHYMPTPLSIRIYLDTCGINDTVCHIHHDDVHGCTH